MNIVLMKARMQLLRMRCNPGSIIRLERFGDPSSWMMPGALGRVIKVDDAGQIHVKWFNGSENALIPGIDKFRVMRGAIK